MKHLWPQTPHQDAVVFVDWMNVYLSQFNLFQGKTGVEIIIERIIDQAKSLGTKPLIDLYLNTEDFSARQRRDWLLLNRVCEQTGLRIIHVPSRRQIDDVDAALIRDMYSANRSQDPTTPFLLVSRDMDFAETVERTSRDRPVFVSLPVNMRESDLRRVATCRQLDSNVRQHMAAWDLLCSNSSTSESYIARQRRRGTEYNRAFELIELIINYLPQMVPGTSFDATLQQLRREHPEEHLTQGEWAYYLKAFEHYGVVRSWRDGLRLRRNHLAYLTLVATRP